MVLIRKLVWKVYKNFLKRILDLLLVLVVLVVISPVLIIVAVLVRIKLGAPILFKQERPGKDEKIFCMYKFRTMTDKRGKDGELLSDEERMTSFGKKLRSTSLDELPELFNILKGDMSIVGPRPLLVSYLPLYNQTQKRRHEVRPGITGLAQVNGRNSLSWAERFEWDVQYVDNITFWGDCKIILRTIKTVLRREGITDNNSVTMSPFTGNDDKR